MRRGEGLRPPGLGLALAMLVVVNSGCAGAPVTTEPAASPSDALSAGSTADCPEIDLRSPRGDRIDLSGVWEEQISEDQPPRVWWIRQVEGCIWGAVMSGGFPESQAAGYDLQVLRGTVDSSFVIRGDLIEVAPMDQVELNVFPIGSSVRFVIDFDDAGAIVIREDRVAGVEGPRCPDPAFHCLPPAVLTRAD